MPTAKKDLSYYLALHYSCELTHCEEGGYFARHPDLEGCATQAETVEEALANLQEARELWLESSVSDHSHVPEPPNEEPSGRLMLRVPLRLHAALERIATRFGLKVNRLLNEVLFNHANQLPLEHGLERKASLDMGASEIPKTSIEYYASLRFPFEVTASEDGGFVAEHPDLPGCYAQGESVTEAVNELNAARELWISSRLEEGLPIPDPLPLNHTGIISLRMPPALHFQIGRDAVRNGVSLNQCLVMVLSEFVGGVVTRERLEAEPDRSLAVMTQQEIVQRVVPLLKQTNAAVDRKLLDALGKNRADFLAGLLHLEKRAFEEAFSSFESAYKGGLNFTTVAVELYHSMPRRLAPRQLHNLLLQLSQVIPGNTPVRREVNLLMVTWLEGIKKKPRRQEQWFIVGREKRVA